MGKKIRIRAGQVEVSAELNDGSTARQIYDSLPIEGTLSTWGDEIYFHIPVQAPLESGAREIVELGDLGYWPTGSAFCVFFGPTPASRGGEIRAASAVNIVGRVKGDPTVFKRVGDGLSIVIEKA